MTNQDDWGYELGPSGGSIGPVGRPKPLAADELNLVPEKGNLGGPGNQAANSGAGVQEYESGLEHE